MQLVRLAFGHNSLASDQTTLALSSPVPLQNYLWTLKNASQTFLLAHSNTPGPKHNYVFTDSSKVFFLLQFQVDSVYFFDFVP